MSEFIVQWTDPAGEDLDELSDYLIRREGNLLAAEEVVSRILGASAQLSSLPWSGKPGRRPGTREWLVKKTRYALVYTVSDDIVSIVRVMHGSRLFPEQPAEGEPGNENS